MTFTVLSRFRIASGTDTRSARNILILRLMASRPVSPR
jgi:hypothetical protein